MKATLARSIALTIACATTHAMAITPDNVLLHNHEVGLEGQGNNLIVGSLTHNNIFDTPFSGSFVVMHDTEDNNTAPGAGLRYNIQPFESIPNLYTNVGFQTYLTDNDYVNTPNGQVRLGLDYVFDFSDRRGIKFGVGVAKNFSGGDDVKEYTAFLSVSWMSNNSHHIHHNH